jgi:hypothetical protein
MLGWVRCSFHKKSVGVRYAELVFLHLVGSAGHVLYSNASRPRNIDVLFFMFGWDWCIFHENVGRVTPNFCFCI